jgi:hypothetical protein
VVSLVLSANGVDTPVTRPVTALAGTVNLEGKVPEITAGTYSIQAIVSDGIDIVRTDPKFISIAGLAPTPPASPSPTATVRAAVPARGSGGPPVLLLLLGLMAIPVALAAALLIRRRRRSEA